MSNDPDLILDTVVKTKYKVPSMWKVIILNDDYTPQDFVVLVLIEIFKKSKEQAEEIMLRVHHSGRGIAGIYTLEIAEEKIKDASLAATSNGHPLRFTLEEE